MNRIKTLRFTGSSGSFTAPAGVTQVYVTWKNTTNNCGPNPVPYTVTPNSSYTVNVTTTSVFGSISIVKTINYLAVS